MPGERVLVALFDIQEDFVLFWLFFLLFFYFLSCAFPFNLIFFALFNDGGSSFLFELALIDLSTFTEEAAGRQVRIVVPELIGIRARLATGVRPG